MTDTASISARLREPLEITLPSDVPLETVQAIRKVMIERAEAADLLDRLLAAPEGMETNEEERKYWHHDWLSLADMDGVDDRDALRLLRDHDRLTTALAAERSRADRLAEALTHVKTWAEQRCPCTNEQPNPCPLCGADANKPGDMCLSAENTIPRAILTEIRTALAQEKTK